MSPPDPGQHRQAPPSHRPSRSRVREARTIITLCSGKLPTPQPFESGLTVPSWEGKLRLSSFLARAALATTLHSPGPAPTPPTPTPATRLPLAGPNPKVAGAGLGSRARGAQGHFSPGQTHQHLCEHAPCETVMSHCDLCVCRHTCQ